MRVTFAYYLLLIYIVAMCKPMLPVAKDILAHVFWKSEHLTTVHHHHGEDHLHTELKKVAGNDNEDENTQTSKNSEPVSIHIVVKNNYDLNSQFMMAKNYPSKYYNLQNTFLEINSPPPKF